MHGMRFAIFALLTMTLGQSSAQEWYPLFPKDGLPQGWAVRAWNDVSQPLSNSVAWRVERGVLQGGELCGTWLMSEKEYGDFSIE